MKPLLIRLWCLTALLFVVGSSAEAFDFSGIQNWVGSGPNQAAFVVAWYDSKFTDPMVWGYRWTGSAPTMLGMMQAISAAVPQLSFTPHPRFSQPPSYAVYSMFYDLTGKGGTPTVGTPADFGGTENGFPPYPGDHYKEGWLINGFWGALTANGNPYNGGSWVKSGVGIAGVTISTNSWYAMSFSTDETNFTIPSPPVPQQSQVVPAAPGPGTKCALLVVVLVIAAKSRRLRGKARLWS